MSFEQEFLQKYLALGLGSMAKTDVDALVMHLIDKYGHQGSPPMAIYKNQTVSERLRTPVAKVKKLRYEAALKYGGGIEEQAMARLLLALAQSSFDVEGDKICLIIEDTLAKNWLQGQLKNNQLIFEHSFNTEILKVNSDGLFAVLKQVFDLNALNDFEQALEKAKDQQKAAAIRQKFNKLAFKFAETAAKKAGGSVATIFKLLTATA